MSTQYKKAVAGVDEVAKTLGALKAKDVHHTAFDPATWACNINAALKQLADLHIDVMQKKAGEADPQRRMYGPSMSAKVLDLAKKADGLKEELLDLAAQAKPLAAAQAAKQPSGLPAEQSHSVELPSTAKRQSVGGSGSMQAEHSVEDAVPQAVVGSPAGSTSQPLNGPGPAIVPKPIRPPAQKHGLPKRPNAAQKYVSAFHPASQRAPPPEQSTSTTRECDTEPSETPNAATEQYQREVYRGRSGQLVDKPAPITTKRSHSAGLPVSVRSQRVPAPLPVSITGQRSLQLHHVSGGQPPPQQQQRPPMTASEYQRSIYRGDSSRLGQPVPGQAAQQLPGAGVPCDAAAAAESAQPKAPRSASAEPPQVRHALQPVHEKANGAPEAAQGRQAAPAGAASTVPVPAPDVKDGHSGSGSKVAVSQTAGPEVASGSSQAEGNSQQRQQSPPSTSGKAVAQVPSLDMPPLPPPAVRHVHMGSAEVKEVLKAAMEKAVLLDFSASWCGPCRIMKPVLERLAERYWGVLDILAIDCEATPTNRQLAQEYAIRGFPTFVLLHKGRRVDQFSGARPEPAMAQYLEWHMSQVGAQDALLQQRLFAALSHLRQHAPPDAFKQAFSMLATILGNLVDKAEEARFRRIRRSSKAFQQSLGTLPGGPECLLAIGFTHYIELNGEQVFVMNHIPRDLGTVRSLLAAVLDTGPAPSTAAMGASSSSAGQVAAAAPAPVQGLLEHRRTISQLVAALPRTSERVQTGPLGPHNVTVMAERIANAFIAMRGRTQSGGNLDVDTVHVAGSTPELEDDDTDLSDVLKRSLEEH